jgi:hypothetical protein
LLARLYGVLAALSIASMLALGLFGSFLALSGRLNGERLAAVTAVLRGELPAAPAPEAAEPASQPQPPSAEHKRRSEEEIHQQHVQDQLTRALAERALRDIAARQELLDRALQHLIQEGEKFDRSKSDWLTQQEKLRQKVRDEGFEHELKLVAGLSPAQAKDHLLRKWSRHPADAVRLLRGMPASKATRILEQFRTAEELQTLHELLEQLGQQETDGKALESGRTSSDA